MSFVPIDSFQGTVQPTATDPVKTEQQPSPSSSMSGLEEEGIEDDGTALEFEIEAEQENHDYELPSIDLLDSRKTTDQSDEYKKIEKILAY